MNHFPAKNALYSDLKNVYPQRQSVIAQATRVGRLAQSASNECLPKIIPDKRSPDKLQEYS